MLFLAIIETITISIILVKLLIDWTSVGD
jgi:hypothetical protein